MISNRRWEDVSAGSDIRCRSVSLRAAGLGAGEQLLPGLWARSGYKWVVVLEQKPESLVPAKGEPNQPLDHVWSFQVWPWEPPLPLKTNGSAGGMDAGEDERSGKQPKPGRTVRGTWFFLPQ